MFSKILIANRGEIAVRIIRAAREMGISPVAVFSECDRPALHVRMADEAYLLGPSPSAESYLNIAKIIEIAKRCGAQAVHPGYGFLAENPEFPRRCQASGISFIGPSAAAMEQMGEKIAARKTALRCGVPVVPGTEEPLSSGDAALEAAGQIGFPLIIKAAAGGGGKGMRLVYGLKQVPSALREAQSEAKAAFGDPTVYMEKYLSSPRHIEFQIIADKHGHILHLGERECSIQRRHQKLIEESPSPLMTDELRARMGEAAVRVAEACGYENAGTVEFLVDSQRNFYFLEMNTRLQVEHPVTEMVTGIDLVKEQIKIAGGESLSCAQEDILWQGSAIECRIYAEDPENNFFPSPGKIARLRTPSGPGIRDDSGVYEGWTVPIFYDPLLSKLITWGKNRNEAIQRMRRALEEYQIVGIKTSIGFFQSILCHQKFLAGDLSTDFIEKNYAPKGPEREPGPLLDVAAIAAALYAERNGNRNSPPIRNGESPWKLWGRLNSLRNK
jgi:acetyl-CoA carboxylase, biotin carboxylase subunit